MANSIMWFRRDLRLLDNPAWSAATTGYETTTPLFVLDERLLATAGQPRLDVLFGALAGLDEQLRHLGGRLRLERGDPATVITAVANELGAAAVYANADTSPYSAARDRTVAETLGVPLRTSWGTLLHRPGTVLTQAGTLSKVFTPFYKAWSKVPVVPIPSPGPAAIAPALTTAVSTSAGESVDDLGGDPIYGEAGALARLEAFNERVDAYVDDRNIPSVNGTSQLGADLRFGTLSPHTVVREIGDATPGRAGFVRQLAWRDWYAHLLAEHPHFARRSLKPEFDHIGWDNNVVAFDAWRAGMTGYPIVDAGMRQLASTGWMHNRVRMIVASFLVKDLLIDWRWGERHFRHLLVDGEVAQNAGNWQWVAGTGPDASPYFRVFNPTLQSKKFDPDGAFIRTWLPELSGLSKATIHAPSDAGPLELAAAGVYLGDTYPWPIVDHFEARDRTIAAYGAAQDVAKDPA
jgi:deoxyribodipyrimidine photo-lyase